MNFEFLSIFYFSNTLNFVHLKVFGTDSSNMAQDSLQDEIHLHGAGFCLDFWNWFQCGIHDSNCRGNFNLVNQF